VSDIAPCPWCADSGNPAVFSTELHATCHAAEVLCRRCVAQGPRAERETKSLAENEAIRLWNARANSSGKPEVSPSEHMLTRQTVEAYSDEGRCS